MVYLKVMVNKIIYNKQPGLICCTFIDVHHKQWTIVEKIPVLFSADRSLPKLSDEGFYIPGYILSKTGNNIVFSTLEPFGISNENSETTFVVSKDQVREVQS